MIYVGRLGLLLLYIREGWLRGEGEGERCCREYIACRDVGVEILIIKPILLSNISKDGGVRVKGSSRRGGRWSPS